MRGGQTWQGKAMLCEARRGETGRGEARRGEVTRARREVMSVKVRGEARGEA